MIDSPSPDTARPDSASPGADGDLWSKWNYTLGELPGGEVQLCAACRKLGHCRLGLTEERLDEEGRNRTRLTCPPDADAGPGGAAHGGWVASALDEVLGHTVILSGHLAVTGTLTVRFLHPAPVGRPMLGVGRVVRREGSRWYLEGELQLESTGAVIARAEGVWVERDGIHYDRFQQWLAEQDSIAAAAETEAGAGAALPSAEGTPAS